MDAPSVPNLTAPRPTPAGRRDLVTLPKAHLHLHFTGAMRPTTMVDMARAQGVRLPPNLLHIDAASMPADGRGWFRFQRAYDSARHLVRSEAAMRRLIREAAEDDAAEGSVRMEIQADPTSYAPYVGGITPALEIIIDEARLASRDTGVDIGVIVAASRMKHPLDARTLARLAASFAGDGPGDVVGLACRTTSAWVPPLRLLRRSASRAAPGSWAFRTAANSWARPPCARSSPLWLPPASGTGCAPARTRRCCAPSWTRASLWRCARRRTCTWACTRTSRRCRCRL